jgi:hypothetical protein
MITYNQVEVFRETNDRVFSVELSGPNKGIEIGIFEFFKTQITTLFAAFALAFEGDWQGFGEKLREYWDTAWAAIQAIGETVWTAIQTFFTETDWGAVGKAILEGVAKGITDAVGGLIEAAKNAAKAAYDAAMGFIGGGLGNGHNGESYPGVPGHNAMGTNNWRGGLTWVGERGPELLNLPSGSQILSAQRLERLLRQTNEPRGQAQINIYGLTLEGVQNKAGLLAELQALT